MSFNILQPSLQYVGYRSSRIFGDGESLILYSWPLENFHWIKPMMKQTPKQYKIYEYKNLIK